MTTAEYLQTDETVLPRELAYGVLRVADSPTVTHQRTVGELYLKLAPFVRERGLGEVLLAPMDVVLDYDAALVVQPDLLFLSRERLNLATDRVFGAPDLVIEVLSPQPRIGQIEERIGWFARYGVGECWLVHLVKREIVVLALGEGRVANRELFTGADPVRSSVLGAVPLTAAALFGY